MERFYGECRFLTLHGRWKSLEAKNMYVKEPGERRLRATKVLGFVAFFPTFLFSVSITWEFSTRSSYFIFLPDVFAGCCILIIELYYDFDLMSLLVVFRDYFFPLASTFDFCALY